MGESFFSVFGFFTRSSFFGRGCRERKGESIFFWTSLSFPFFSFFLENVSSGVPAGAAPFLACVFFI